MRIILMSFFCLLIAGCSTPKMTPEDAFKQGDYLTGIAILAADLNEKGEKDISKRDIEQLKQVVTDLTFMAENQIHDASPSDYLVRIDSYKILLSMKTFFDGKFYSQYIASFLNNYPNSVLKEQLAKEYYQYGNSISPKTAADYEYKASLYNQGLKYFNYKDINKLYTINQNKYYQTAASEYYQKGASNAKLGNYQDAANFFQQAYTVYLPLGSYKDSNKLAALYEKKYRSAEAEKNFQKAVQLTRASNTKQEFRRIAQYYQKAADIYSPYGDYKNSAALAKRFGQKGQINIYIQSNEYNQEIRRKLDQRYVTFVTSPTKADMIITIKLTDYYRQPPDKTEVNRMSEYIQIGTEKITKPDGTIVEKPIFKTFYFNAHSKEQRNELELTAKVSVTGNYHYSQNYNVRKYSSEINYWYTGDVPPKYKGHKSDGLRSKNKLYNEAKSDIDSDIRNDLTTINRALKDL